MLACHGLTAPAAKKERAGLARRYTLRVRLQWAASPYVVGPTTLPRGALVGAFFFCQAETLSRDGRFAAGGTSTIRDGTISGPVVVLTPGGAVISHHPRDPLMLHHSGISGDYREACHD